MAHIYIILNLDSGDEAYEWAVICPFCNCSNELGKGEVPTRNKDHQCTHCGLFFSEGREP